MKKKSTRKYIFLLFLPVILFILILVFNSLGKSTLTSSNSCNSPALGITNSQEQACLNTKSTGTSNSFSFVADILGVVAGILLLFGTPFWIVKLIKTSNYNKSINNPPSQPQQYSQPIAPQPPNNQTPPKY